MYPEGTPVREPMAELPHKPSRSRPLVAVARPRRMENRTWEGGRKMLWPYCVGSIPEVALVHKVTGSEPEASGTSMRYQPGEPWGLDGLALAPLLCRPPHPGSHPSSHPVRISHSPPSPSTYPLLDTAIFPLSHLSKGVLGRLLLPADPTQVFSLRAHPLSHSSHSLSLPVDACRACSSRPRCRGVQHHGPGLHRWLSLSSICAPRLSRTPVTRPSSHSQPLACLYVPP